MKYLALSIAFICLLITSSKAQTNTPTKEKTIEWIAEKLVRYCNNEDIKSQYGFPESLLPEEGGKIEIDHWRQGDLSSTGEFNLNDVYNYILHKNPQYNNDIGIDLFIRNNSAINKNSDGDITARNSHVLIKINWDGEDNLFNRFKAALDNLIKFNNQDAPKETY